MPLRYELRANAGPHVALPDFALTAHVVAAPVRQAALQASAELTRLGIKHALIGGLAVGANGYPRATADVDFLVSEDAFDHHGPLVSFRPGVPITVGQVRIDYLTDDELLARVPERDWIVDAAAVVLLKLRAGRAKDEGDIIGLCQQAQTARTVRAFVALRAPELVSYLDALLQRGARE